MDYDFEEFDLCACGKDNEGNILFALSEEQVKRHSFALKFTQKIMQEPSDGVQSMSRTGAAVMWDECKDGLIGCDQAKAVFTAMRDQAIKEIRD